MKQQFAARWYTISDSMWFVPSLITLGGALLALATVRIDQHIKLGSRGSTVWLFGGGVDGARGVLSSISSTMITVTGLVFSITIVALQLASSQFSPRLLRAFTGDRGNQVVMGVFIATFTYSLLVLRSVQSESDNRELFVPALSVSVSIVLALASIACLIFFIHHATRSIQVAVIISRAAHDTQNLIERIYPDSPTTQRLSKESEGSDAGFEMPVRTKVTGYLQDVHVATLERLDEQGVRSIDVLPLIGDFVIAGEVVAHAYIASEHMDTPESLREAIEHAVQAALILGDERTLKEDVRYGFRQLSDIALKALSPGINDPTTATMCIDRMAGLLVSCGTRQMDCAPEHKDPPVTVVILPRPTFADIADVAITQVRVYGASDPVVASHLVAVLGRTATQVRPEHRPVLNDHMEQILVAASVDLRHRADIARVESARSGPSY